MATLVPVDHDPFAEQGGAQPSGGPRLVPVDHDPFAAEAADMPARGAAPAEFQVPPAPEGPSKWKSAAAGALQGATFNFGDEAAAGINAGIDYLIGEAPNGIGEAYDRRLASTRQQIGALEKANPGSYLAGQIGGGLATMPLTPVKAGVAGGLATGALYGALSGAGAGEGVGGRLSGAAVGGAVGGAIGAAAPVVIGGIATGARKAGDAIRGATGMVRGAISPESEAARRVTGALARDAQIGGTQLDDAALSAARAQGQPAAVADMGGETTRALARSAANTSPEGRAALEQLTSDRFETQGPRVVEFVQRLSGTAGDAGATREALQAAAKTANRGAYGRAYSEGAAGVWDDTLARLAQAPAMQAEIRDATRRSANKAVSEGFGPVRNPFVAAADGSITMKPGISPSLQFWDVVKQGLDDQVEKLKRAGANSEMRDMVALRNGLREHLDRLVPSYAAARKGAAAAFDAEDALEAGQKFVTSSLANNDAKRAMMKLSGPERKLFAEGFASSLIEQVNRTGDRRNVINAIYGTPRARERVELALGREKAAELEAFIRVENTMDMLRRAVSGNSTTARQLAELGLAGGAYSAYQGDFSVQNVAIGALLGAALRRGSQKIDGRVSQKVAEMLASDDPTIVRKAASLVAKNKPLLEAVKAAEDRVARVLMPAANSNVARPLEVTVRGISSNAAPQHDERDNR